MLLMLQIFGFLSSAEKLARYLTGVGCDQIDHKGIYADIWQKYSIEIFTKQTARQKMAKTHIKTSNSAGS